MKGSPLKPKAGLNGALEGRSGGFGGAFDFGPVVFGEVEGGGFHVFFEMLDG